MEFLLNVRDLTIRPTFIQNRHKRASKLRGHGFAFFPTRSRSLISGNRLVSTTGSADNDAISSKHPRVSSAALDETTALASINKETAVLAIVGISDVSNFLRLQFLSALGFNHLRERTSILFVFPIVLRFFAVRASFIAVICGQ